jgi:hypothetical protein
VSTCTLRGTRGGVQQAKLSSGIYMLRPETIAELNGFKKFIAYFQTNVCAAIN